MTHLNLFHFPNHIGNVTYKSFSTNLPSCRKAMRCSHEQHCCASIPHRPLFPVFRICQGRQCSFNCNRKQLCQKSTVFLGFFPTECLLFYTTPPWHSRSTGNTSGLPWLLNGHILYKRTHCFTVDTYTCLYSQASPRSVANVHCAEYRYTTKYFPFSCI